jgi:hypothetical protein
MDNKMTNTTYESVWISKVVSAGGWIRQPLLRSILFFGLPCDILVSIFLVLRRAEIPRLFFIPYILCLVWLNIGPYLIWYYNNKLFPAFIQRLGEILPNGENQQIGEKYSSRFARKFWIFPIPWTFLFLFIVFHNGNPLDLAGTRGYGDPWSWLLLPVILWIAFLAGVGTWGVATTLMATNAAAKKKFILDPLHPDNRGGLGCIGYYAIGTTLLIASGSLFLPMAFQLAIDSVSPRQEIDVYAAVCFYTIFILLSYLYPTSLFSFIAKTKKREKLDELRKIHNRFISPQGKTSLQQPSSLEYYMEKFQVRREYDDYKNLKLYPLEMDTLAKLTSSVILPILLIMLQSILFK